MKVTATDTRGNEFIKTVTVQEGQGFHEGIKILDFGWPVQYTVPQLLTHYPFQEPMCIDMSGRNHKGYPVSVSAEQMDKILEELILDKEKLPFG